MNIVSERLGSVDRTRNVVTGISNCEDVAEKSDIAAAETNINAHVTLAKNELFERFDSVVSGFGFNAKLIINATANAADIPDAARQAELLDGAHIELQVGSKTSTFPITSLAANSFVNLYIPWNWYAGQTADAIVTVYLNQTAIAGTNLIPMTKKFTAREGVNVVLLDMKYATSAVSGKYIGFREFLDHDWSVVQDIWGDETGDYESQDYLNTSTSTYVKNSALNRAIPEVDLATGEIKNWFTHDGEAARNDIFGIGDVSASVGAGFFPFNAIGHHEYSVPMVASNGVTRNIVSKLTTIGDRGSERSGWWVKVEEKNVALESRTYTDDTNYTSEITTQAVREWRIAETQIDSSYKFVHIPDIGTFKSSKFQVQSGTYPSTLEYDIAPATPTPNTTAYVEYSNYISPTGGNAEGFDNGVQRYRHIARTKLNNRDGATFDGAAVVAKDGAMNIYSMRVQSALIPLMTIICGTRNVQNYIWGDATGNTGGTSSVARVNGCTRKIIDTANLNFGVPYFGGVSHDPSTTDASFVALGLENPWCSTGTFYGDVSALNAPEADGTPTDNNSYIYYCDDRSKWTGDFSVNTIGSLSPEQYLNSLGYRKCLPAIKSGYIKNLLGGEQNETV